MFQITPSKEFSTWFEALSAPLAEEVACALDLLAEAGTAIGPSQTSRALLWFDGTRDLPAAQNPLLVAVNHAFLRRRSTGELSCPADDVRELLLWQREVVRCLESPAFTRRLAGLEPKAAALALASLEVLKSRLHVARTRIALESGASEARRRGRFLQPRGASEVGPETSLSDSLKQGFFEVLRLTGLSPSELMNSTSGLCELTIATSEPQLRVLFGLDAPGQRIVVLLGEALDRAYYGESVKHAEQRWQQYCAEGGAEAFAVATSP